MAEAQRQYSLTRERIRAIEAKALALLNGGKRPEDDRPDCKES